MTEEDLIHTLALQHAPKIGAVTAKKLIAHCGSAADVFKERKDNLLKIDGIGTVTIKGLFNKQLRLDAENELKFIKANAIKVHCFSDSSYPERLKHCIDGPILLFQSGNITLHTQPIISIVGTRKITTKGIAFCEQLIDALKAYNPVIVSGFAYGTDITAQKLAIKHNLQTIGCLAHGLDQIYPKSHKKYVSAVEAYGGFYTDFWSTDTFERTNFLKRNRIIAGMSEATIVIESAEKGGSLVTADLANSYNREVFAVPGRPTDNQSIGCNNLIKFQKAHLLSHPLDVPYILNWQLDNPLKKAIQKQLFVELSEVEKTIYALLKNNSKMLLDTIALESHMPNHKVASILMNMELRGVVRPLPGKYFELI